MLSQGCDRYFFIIQKIILQNLSFRVECYYRYTKGDVYIMGRGHILYCLYISMVIFVLCI